MKKRSKEVEPTNEWWCQTCNTKEPMNHEGMIEHLKTVHALDTKGLKGKKSMLMHMDGDTWFSYQWEWTLGEGDKAVKMLQATTQPRAKVTPNNKHKASR